MQKSKRKKAGRMLRLAIVIIAFVLITASVLLSAAALLFFRVEKYNVEGVSPYTRDEIISASGIETGKSLIFINLEEAQASIEKKLPYTGSVRVSRKFPNTLVIRYDECKERYAISLATAGFVILGDDFKTLSFSATLPEGVTLLLGTSPLTPVVGEKTVFSQETVQSPDGESEVVDTVGEMLAEITRAIDENGLEDISALSISSRSNIYLIYQRRIVLKLGNPSDVSSKLALAKNVLEEENSLSPDQFGVLNLTVTKQAYFNSCDADEIDELVELEENFPLDLSAREEVTSQEESEISEE